MFFFSSRRRHTRCALVTGVRRVLFRSQRGGLADAVLRPIRIRMRYDGGTVGFAGIHVQGKRVPAAKDVVLADHGRQDEFVGRAVAHAQIDQAGGFFLDIDVDGSEGSRVGKEFVRSCWFRWEPYIYKQHTKSMYPLYSTFTTS